MTESDAKADLHRYLQDGRDAMLWKLDGLSEYDVRRPLVPTGTNLLGLVKHLAGVELGYFGETFGRPWDGPSPADESDPESDMFATPAESRVLITGLYRQAWAHSDATIEALPLDSRVTVAWWPDGHRDPTLSTLLVHMIQETARHAGQADILRESIDGAAGVREESSGLREPAGADGWKRHYDKLETIARSAGDPPGR